MTDTNPRPSVGQSPATKRVVHLGELTTRPRLLARGLAMLTPGALWMLALLVAPSLLLVALAFATRGGNGEIIFFETNDAGMHSSALTLEHFRRFGYDDFGWTPDVVLIFARTILLSVVTTGVCILVAYPAAFFIAARPPRWRYACLVAVVIPLCTNLVIRTYAWQLIFSTGSPLSRVAEWMGLIDAGEGLYPGVIAVYVGMVASSLPFAVLPLYASIERLDWSLVEAARDLGASPWRVFRHAILPQTRAGLTVACILTFVPAMGMFVVSDLLGGSKYMLIGNLIQHQFFAGRNFPYGAALSLTLVLLALAALALYRRRSGEGGWL